MFNFPSNCVVRKSTSLFQNRRRLLKNILFNAGVAFLGSITHSPVEAVGTEAMSTLGLKRSSEYVVTAVAQVLVLQLIAQDLLGEAGFIALHGRRRGRFLCGHGVCSHVTPEEKSQTRGRDYFNLMQQLEKS